MRAAGGYAVARVAERVRRGPRWLGQRVEQALANVGDEAGAAPLSFETLEAVYARRWGDASLGALDPAVPELVRELDRRGARARVHQIGGPHRRVRGRTLDRHLLGTWRMLACWGQSRVLRRAALMHSVYDTDTHPLPFVPLRERQAFVRLAGPGAEAIAFVFSTIDNEALPHEALRSGRLPEGEWTLRNRRSGERVRVRSATLRAMLVLEMANLADQAIDHRDGGPAPWLATCARVAAGMPSWCLPSALDGFAGSMSRLQEQGALARYRELTRGATNDAARWRALRDINPWVAEPELALARATTGDERREHAKRAQALLLAWGTAWDKRQDWFALVREARELAA